MKNNTVVVMGAGMVGVACALELQRRGATVTLVDRREPGQETSYGNAGVMARSSLMPFNNPGLWRGLPKLLGNQSAQFRYNPWFLARNPRWALGFLARARQSIFQETAAVLDALIRLSLVEHKRLMGEAQILHRLRENGWLFLYRSAAAYAGSRLARDTMDHFGVATETLDRKALSDLEPALRPIFDRALWIKDASSVDDPSQVVQAYARLFVARGGLIRKAAVAGLQVHQDKHWKVLDDAGGHLEAERVVVALGPWSKAFLAPLEISVPMAFERGYHMHYGCADGITLKRPVYDTGGAYVLSPMERGLRLTTGVELDDCDAPPRHVQLELAEKAARQAISMGERMEREVWLGRRPTLPDSRPIIGEMPGRPGLWLAFGHQHVGFSTGPGTAALLGAQMCGDVLPIDPEPFRAGRFLSA